MTTPSTHRYLRNITMVDFTENGFSGDQLDVLLDIFEHALKKMLALSDKNAVFNTTDFAPAKKAGIAGFELRFYKKRHHPGLWRGVFERNDQRVHIIARTIL